MPVNEQVMAIGDWSVQLRPDTPQSIRDAIGVNYGLATPVGGAFAHIVITNSRIDVSNAGLDDDAIRSAARYTGVCLRPGPQLNIGGAGLAWWMGDADDQPQFTWGAVSAITWSAAYTTAVGGRFDMGSLASGGSFTVPAQSGPSRRNRLDTIAQVAGHEWRINPDLTVDADTVANLYGTVPTVVLLDGGTARGGALVGLDATFEVEEDWEQWADGVTILTPSGAALASSPVEVSAPSAYPTGGHVTKSIRIDVPDVPQGFEEDVADDYGTLLSQPRYEVTVQVRDRTAVDYVRPGDLLYVYDELKGLRDFDNQVEHQGRTIWPKVMRATRMSWPILQGMGVYFRNYNPDELTPVYVDLTPYVQWEDGDAQIDIIEGDAGKYTLNPVSGRVDQVGAAIERAQAQPWVTYTPTWTAAGTDPALVNGTIVGAYRRQGTTLHFGGMLTIGSSTTFGTGGWEFTLPSGCTAVAGRRQSCSGSARDVGSGLSFSVTGDIAAGGSLILFGSDRHSSTSGFYTGEAGTVPHAWASGDTLAWSGTIEIAP
jgi:hypothetical protein